MKTIIIFLFLCSISIAQYNTYDLIIEYEQECFNDSSLQHTHTPKWNDKCLAQRGNLAEGYHYDLVCEDSSHYSYVHKEPSWEGFREFVKRKYEHLLRVQGAR
jgi:hypothetical protein